MLDTNIQPSFPVVSTTDHDGAAIQTVDARELHTFLKVRTEFSTWIKGRITKYALVRGTDFEVFEDVRFPNSGSAKARAQKVTEYDLTLDTAQSLTRLERSERSEPLYRYFAEYRRAPVAAERVAEPVDATAPLASGEPTMSSLEIAELTGKQHDNVLRDTRNMLETLGENTALKFEGCYKGANGKQLPCYYLPKRECFILVSGYDVQLRARIIDRWMELEAHQSSSAVMTTAEFLAAQAQLMVEIERKQAALLAVQTEQGHRIDAAERRLQQIETATDYFTCVGYARWAKQISIDLQTAAQLGQRATRLCQKLGAKIYKIPDPRFGIVGQYPKAILDEVWDEVMGARQ